MIGNGDADSGGGDDDDDDDDDGTTYCWNLNTPSSLGSRRGSAVDNTWSKKM